MPTHEPILITYRCDHCRGRFTERRMPGPRPRYCPGCDAELRQRARTAHVGRPAPRARGITPALLRPARGNPRKG